MANTDEADLVWPGFSWQLRAALARVEPRIAIPRYAALPPARPLRVTRIALALSLAGIAALTAAAAAGSTNPTVWQQRIVTTLQSSPAATPSTESRGGRSSGAAVPKHPATPEHSEEPRPSPEPSESPERTSGEGEH